MIGEARCATTAERVREGASMRERERERERERVEARERRAAAAVRRRRKDPRRDKKALSTSGREGEGSLSSRLNSSAE